MEPEIIMTILGGIFAGGAGAEIIRWLRSKAVDASTVIDSLYPILNQELTRLSTQLDRLQALIVALESEVVILGGDPLRIRQQVARDLGDLQ